MIRVSTNLFDKDINAMSTLKNFGIRVKNAFHYKIGMRNKNLVAVFLGHPAHYHMFKNMVNELRQNGMDTIYIIKTKDILEQLVSASGEKYYVIRKRERKASGKISMMLSLICMDIRMFLLMITIRPKLLIGTYTPFISHISGVPCISVCEDDTDVVPFFARLSYPFCKIILSPSACNGGKWDKKMTKYEGYQKLAYLHPSQFSPDRSVLDKYSIGHKPYVLMRFSGLNAHHDNDINGMTDELALKIYDIMADKYELYISSERPISPYLEKFRLHINPQDIHHILAFSSLFIGDSQSMTVEAAMLGIPSFRFNDFAGKIGVLKELETKYGLTVGIDSRHPEILLQRISDLLNTDNFQQIYQERRKIMLNEKIDVTKFFVDQIIRL